MKNEVDDRTFKYIGETSRSAHERGEEHWRDLRDLDSGSHFLKHIIQHHMNAPESVEFRMKILSSHYTAFSRQISEAVKINRNKGPYLLNSKSEYNRSTLPCIKTSDKKTKWELSDIDDIEMKESIRILRHSGVKFRKILQIEGENSGANGDLCENEVPLPLSNPGLGENESLVQVLDKDYRKRKFERFKFSREQSHKVKNDDNETLPDSLKNENENYEIYRREHSHKVLVDDNETLRDSLKNENEND